MSNKSPVTDDQPTRRKLTPAQERELCDLFEKGVRQEVLAVQFGVHFNTVKNVVRRSSARGPETTAGLDTI